MTRAEMKKQLESAEKLILASDKIVADSNNALDIFRAKLEAETKQRTNVITAITEKIEEIETMIKEQIEGKEAAKLIFESLKLEISKAEEFEKS